MLPNQDPTQNSLDPANSQTPVEQTVPPMPTTPAAPQQVYSSSPESMSQNSGNKLKKAVIIAAATVLLIAGISFVPHLLMSKKGPGSSSSQTANSAAFATKTACDLFTLSDVKTTIGTYLKPDFVTDPRNDGDIESSTCMYTYSSSIDSYASDASKYGMISISVDGALTNKGADTENKLYNYYLAQAKSNSVVSGLGDRAFYESERGLLHVVKGNYFIDVSANFAVNSNQYDQQMATQIAKVIISKL